MVHGEFKPVTKNKKVVGFITCERDYIGTSLGDVYKGFKFRRYMNNILRTVCSSFDTKDEARQWIKSDQ